MTRFAEHVVSTTVAQHSSHHSHNHHNNPNHHPSQGGNSHTCYDASVFTEDCLQGFTERMSRCAQIVSKRLSEYNWNSTQPVTSNESAKVWSMGPLKSQPAAGHRLVAIAANVNIPSAASYGVAATIRKIYELLTIRRSEWDTSRSSASATLRTVCSPRRSSDGRFAFQCDVVRAAINAVCGGLISPREFLCAEAAWISDHMAFCCGFSLDDSMDVDARTPVGQDFVRGIAHPSGWKFEHTSGTNFTFTYSIHAQPGGLIPMQLVNETAPAELLRVVTNFVSAAQRV